MSFNITPVASGYQEIHPDSAMNIDSVKINTSLIMMKECETHDCARYLNIVRLCPALEYLPNLRISAHFPLSPNLLTFQPLKKNAHLIMHNIDNLNIVHRILGDFPSFHKFSFKVQV